MLKAMLRATGYKVKGEQLTKLLCFMQETCPWFPEEGTVIVRLGTSK